MTQEKIFNENNPQVLIRLFSKYPSVESFTILPYFFREGFSLVQINTQTPPKSNGDDYKSFLIFMDLKRDELKVFMDQTSAYISRGMNFEKLTLNRKDYL